MAIVGFELIDLAGILDCQLSCNNKTLFTNGLITMLNCIFVS